MTDKLTFPVLLTDPDAKNPTTFITIEIPELYTDEEKVLFYVAGGAIEYSDRRSTVSIRATNRFDVEQDRAFVAVFDLDSLALVSAWKRGINFTAWLTKALFYTDINDMVDSQYSDDEGVVYKYQPDAKAYENLKLPMKVNVSFHYDIPDTLEYLDKAMARHEEARLEREEKARKEAEERQKRREESARREAEWLTTEEGKAYLVEKTFNNAYKFFYDTEPYTEERKAAVIQAMLNHYNELPEEDKARLKGQLNSRRYRYPSKFPSAEPTMVEITALINEQ